MRLSSLAIRFAAFGVAVLLSIVAARAAVGIVEDRSVVAVRTELELGGHEWASVLGDGLQVIIEGDAPSEAMRFRAMSLAGTMVDSSRVIDNMSVTDAAVVAAPEFSIEILRNDSGISLIGLIPVASDRDDITMRIGQISGDLPVTDLLEVADHPMPEGWRGSVNFALRALDRLPRSKISVDPGMVTITAVADSLAEKQRLEAELSRQVPEGVRLALQVTAPRPVITPFTTRFILDEEGARFDACSADSEAAQQQIIGAAIDAGLQGRVSCTLGLGVPSPEWADAVATAIGAVTELGGGTVTFSDVEVYVQGPEGTDPEVFTLAMAGLDEALPDVFALESSLPAPPAAPGEEIVEFSATLSPEGLVQLRGAVSDELMNTTAANFARARFGQSDVTVGTTVTEALPSGWSVRVLAAIEALSKLSSGSAVVQAELLRVRGNTGSATANAEIAQLLLDQLGQDADFRVEVNFVEELSQPTVEAPTPEACLARIDTVTGDRKITFEPGSANLDAGARLLVDDIAEVLRECLDIALNIAGYTDSQGRAEMNLQLSQQRADAVVTALRQRRVPTSSFVAIGYGIENPIADNGTEEGREANRRIEFTLIEPEETEEEASGLDQLEAETVPADDAEETTGDDTEASEDEPADEPAGDIADDTADDIADEPATEDGAAPEDDEG